MTVVGSVGVDDLAFNLSHSGATAVLILGLSVFGSLLDHAVIHLVGKPERRAQGKAKIVELVKQHTLTVIAIGNGTACRETEEMVAELLADELKDAGAAYVIVNEAGASVYSTSPLTPARLRTGPSTPRCRSRPPTPGNWRRWIPI